MHDPAGANWIGLWTLYMREVRRFSKVYTQTLLAPMVTTLLFLAVFTLALGKVAPTVGTHSFLEFLAPGLIIMSITQNSFANTSSSLMSLKMQGSIVDTLMPPLTASELHLGFTMGGVTRGCVVGLTLALVMNVIVNLGLHNLSYIVFHAIMASMMLSQLGILGAMWAEKWDHISGVTNFIITPFAFLSGTFYSIQRLPEFAQIAAHFNPFFYMIDGFRYGFIGHADGNIMLGLLVMAVMNLALWIFCTHLFNSGYKLKA
ncbi:MAG: multidrug ABC transporter permease [Magnetovibrio sp.]|nr:multidrug ABC transporter permease [Magnetovibrio sp.]|tara:strand:- start:108 stop:887 length:780 start_codon:yes stop_codon:yes gene_type:complete